jgi:hypothetical protein
MVQAKHMENRMWFGRPRNTAVFTAAYGYLGQKHLSHYNLDKFEI